MKRVVVTGMSGLTSIGQDWSCIEKRLREKHNGIRHMPEWDRYETLNTRLAGPIDNFITPSHYTRKQTRSMGRVALLATRATELAMINAGLLDDPEIKTGAMGIAYGSSSGSTAPVKVFANMLETGSMKGMTATTYIEMMSHTAPVNIALYFGLKGRIITTSTACTSGSQGVGYAYETIKYGRLPMMVAGGAEELCPTQAGVFDSLFATSTKNDTPYLTPRPFDQDRDGLVIGEGAGSLILEDLEHAKARGATIYAEIIGFGCNSDGNHITQPDVQTMSGAMELALEDANLPPSAIGYVNAHGTATHRGDLAESKATHNVFSSTIPISSLKSYLGHTLGACGALESWMSIEMMNNDWYAPTINLDNIDPDCEDLDYIIGNGRDINNEFVMSNNFAFGGINTSLIFKRWK